MHSDSDMSLIGMPTVATVLAPLGIGESTVIALALALSCGDDTTTSCFELDSSMSGPRTPCLFTKQICIVYRLPRILNASVRKLPRAGMHGKLVLLVILRVV